MLTEFQNLPPADVAIITHLNNTEELYYTFLGKLKVLDSDWKLINFLDLGPKNYLFIKNVILLCV